MNAFNRNPTHPLALHPSLAVADATLYIRNGRHVPNSLGHPCSTPSIGVNTSGGACSH